MMRVIEPAVAMAMLTSPAAARDSAFDRAVAAVEERVRAIDSVSNVIPGRAIIMVKAGATPIIDVRGVTRIDGGTPITADTPMYIASMTKAFVGLMAVRLDERGIMPLDMRLGKLFPEMKVEGIDVGALTMRQLLSHQLGFQARALNMRTAYTDMVPINDYTAILNASGKATKPGFDYDNLGYLLYGAALEKKTGKSWRNWIDEVVFSPLGMNHTSARTSDFKGVSSLHERFEDGWRTYDAKPDALMHAAGGLVISPNDMAHWLAANAGAESPIPKASFDKAKAVQAGFEQQQGPVHCTGYAFGWNRCEVFGLTFFEHGGGYTGTRSEMVVVPDRGVAFASMFNSDSMTGGLSGQLMQAFLSAYAGTSDGLPTVEQLTQKYVAETDEYRANRSERERKLLADEKWGGWAWKPTARELEDYAGTYDNAAYGHLELSSDGKHLAAFINGMPIELRPARRDLFAARLASTGEFDELKLVRNPKGEATMASFGGIEFHRH